jgi:hypothetical protein
LCDQHTIIKPTLPPMTLQEHFQKNKLSIIAMQALLCDCAEDGSIVLAESLSGICRQAGVNRTQVYERKAQLWVLFAEIELAGPGRPLNAKPRSVSAEIPPGCQLREQVFRYRLDHPGALVPHAGGSTSYSDGFRRFVLDLADTWEDTLACFCQWAEVPYATLISWQRQDRTQPYAPAPRRAVPRLPASATADCHTIVDDYTRWEGGLRDFLGHEARRLQLAPNAIRRVLAITGMIASTAHSAPRYRGSTERQKPGDILVTDGKGVTGRVSSTRPRPATRQWSSPTTSVRRACGRPTSAAASFWAVPPPPWCTTINRSTTTRRYARPLSHTPG